MKTWYEKGIFYHIYPLGLTGAPRQNTGEQIHDGFKELNEWIPHIQALGCNALYIGPLFQSSSHGYDTIDYRTVDCRLGSNEDFVEFVSLCHKSGIKVVVDGVFNHSGRDFFAFKDIRENRESSDYKDWYKGINFYGNSPFNDSFGYESWQGHAELPAFNLSNPQVIDYLIDVIQFWVDKFDIDGIRLDCANVLDFNFMTEMRRRTESMKQDFWLMGEVIHGDYSRWVNDRVLHSVTNYELHKSIYSAHNDHNYFEIAHNVKRLETVARSLYTFLDNHDEDRIASKLTNKEHLFPAYLLLFTLPGIPSIYYGGEWGLEGKRTKNSDDALRPQLSISQEKNLHCRLTDFITKLAHIHAENPEFHNGRYQELLLTNRQYAFARLSETNAVIAVANNDDKEVTLSIPVPCPATHAVDLIGGAEFSVQNNKVEVQIPGNWGIVLKITEE